MMLTASSHRQYPLAVITSSRLPLRIVAGTGTPQAALVCSEKFSPQTVTTSIGWLWDSPNVILKAPHENNTYTEEKLALAVITGKVSLGLYRGRWLPASCFPALKEPLFFPETSGK